MVFEKFCFFIVLIFCGGEAALKIPCKLDWKAMNSDGTVGGDSIGSQGGDIFVARTFNSDTGQWIIGWVNNINKKAIFPSTSGGTAFINLDIEVLTNNHNCSIGWVDWASFPQKQTKIIVKLGDYYIGRGSFKGNLLAAPVNKATEEISIPTPDLTTEKSKKFEVLTSYIKGFNMKMADFKFDIDPMSSSGLDFMGMDEIHNAANVEVSHTVTYSKEIYSSYSLRESHHCSSSWEMAAALGISLFGLINIGATANAGLFGDSYWEKSLKTEYTQKVTATKLVTVKPYQSVEVCSTISQTPEDFKSNYTAKLTVEAAGWTGEEIAELLIEDGWSNLIIDDFSVTRNVEGTFEGSIGMVAKVQVFPANSKNSCAAIQKKIASNKRKRFLDKQAKFNEKRAQAAKIRDIINRRASIMDLEVKPIATAESIDFFLYNKQVNNYTLYINDAENLRESKFDPNVPVKFLTHGWTSSSSSTVGLKNVLLEESDYNIILINWDKLAAGIQYNVAAANTMLVGRITATLIEFLVARSVTTYDKIHLIGHSLGAHVVAFAGATLIKGKVGRITALDPALPLFIEQCDANRIDPDDGQFVDVIHTSGGSTVWYLAFIEPRGHADFYPNSGKPIQPGCESQDNLLIPLMQSCSHNKVWEFMVHGVRDNSLRNPVKACKCSSWQDFLGSCGQRCTENEKMGIHCSTSARGNYYLRMPHSPV